MFIDGTGVKPWEKMLAKFMTEVTSGEGEGTMALGREPRNFNFIFCGFRRS